MLRRFIAAYQRVQPLTIGELWAVAITLAHRPHREPAPAGRPDDGRTRRARGRRRAGRPASGAGRRAIRARRRHRDALAGAPVRSVFAAQLAKRLRDQDPRTTPALGWLEERLRLQGTSIEEVVQHAQQRQGASNVTVRNVITSMRLISDIDWADLFESVSLVDARLARGKRFRRDGFPDPQPLPQRDRAAGPRLARRRSSRSPSGCCRHRAQRRPRQRDPSEARARRRSRLSPDRRGPAARSSGRSASGRRPAADQPLQHAPRHRRLCRRDPARSPSALLALALWALAAAGPRRRAGSSCSPWSGSCRRPRWRPRWSTGRSPGASARPSCPVSNLRRGVPQSLRTLVAVPTLLTNEADLLEQIERLEVHHLAGAGGDLTFALLLGRRRCGPGDRRGRRASARGRGRGDRATEPPLRPGTGRRPLPPAASPPRVQRRREQVDGMGAQARQAARTQPASARRHRHDLRCRRPAARLACRPTSATSSRSMPTPGCRAMRRCG